ncbi:MAG: thioredoxin family protein [Myxococcota bacterium]|nr:thioredoxin family protein [Myxococcota bacterium]
MAASERNASAERPILPDGLVAFVKRECPTCELVAPVLDQLAQATQLQVYSQDDPAFPKHPRPIDDTDLRMSWHHEIEAVPTLIRVVDGVEVERILGWHRGEWESLASWSEHGQGEPLGASLPDQRAGCGSLSVDPNLATGLAVRFGASRLGARRIELATGEDEFEAMYSRGWSDGLPLVPPTEFRVHAMLEGTTRAPDDIVAIVPPALVPCSVEKVAINAVMAGCKPEYLPVVLTAVEAACTDEFNMHGLLATTMSVGPVVIVNGPIRKRLGMNSGRNALGQGHRANASIGRALQLVIRNVGGGRPGEIDRATLGNPGKLGFCIAEDEEGTSWTSLAEDLGSDARTDCLTLFPGEGPRTLVDQLSRSPESLTRSFAACLRAMYHPKLALAFDAIVVVSPEHMRVFEEAGWTKALFIERLHQLCMLDGDEVVRGAGGIEEGLPDGVRGNSLPKFKPGGLLVIHCGGGAGLFSAIIPGWAGGLTGSQPVTREILQ